MYAVPPPQSNSGMRSLILFRPDTIGSYEHAGDDYSQETAHGFVIASFRIATLPVPMTFAAVHINPFSPNKAVDETKLVATRAYHRNPRMR